MEQSQFNFIAIDSQVAAKSMADLFMQMVYCDNVFQKTLSQRFVTDLYGYLENQNATPKSKFYSLFMLKEIIARNDLKIIGLLSSSAQFMQGLQKIASVDSKKTLSQKGKNLFPQDKQWYGNKIVNIAIQILIYLGKRFPKTSKSQPTRFKKILMKLQSDNVVMPDKMSYFPNFQDENPLVKQKTKTEPKVEQTANAQKKQPPKYQQKEGSKKPVDFELLTGFAKNKILTYMQTLQQAVEVQAMQEQIIKSHEIIAGELKKFKQCADQIFDSKQATQSLINQYTSIRHFLDQQSLIYQKYIHKNNQFDMYYKQIRLEAQKLFASTKKSTDTKNNKKDIKRTDSVVANSKVQYGSKNSIQNDKSKQQRNLNDKPQQTKNKSTIQKRQSKRQSTKTNNLNLLTKVFNQMQSRSRSKSGFKTILDNLQKQKKDIQPHPHSKVNRSSKKPLQNSNLSKNGIKTISIFANVPNTSPPFKIYQGQAVMPSKQLSNILFDIKKEQSLRRFKVSNFKNKYPLYQDQNLQIGFKSEPIFEQYDGFKRFLSIELYFGNKSNRQIKNLQIAFQGDQNCMIYTNPQSISRYIEAQSQIKHSLMIIPNKLPFGFINMRLLYQSDSFTTHTTVALPTSIVKLSTLIQASKSEFSAVWSQVTHRFKTDLFKLSQHFPPNSLRKYLPNLGELTRYSDFSLSGSVTDYQLFCFVDIFEVYQGALKIVIRPNLSVVIQIGGIQPNQQDKGLLKFYIQSLQMLLQE